MKNFHTQKRIIVRKISSISRKILSFFIQLQFMKNNKVNISVFNRYLILFITILFTYCFYLSIPSFYNYDKLQKDFKAMLLNEFKLNIIPSSDIKYRILPSPHFEIKNAILSSGSDYEFNEFGEIKKIKIFISIPKLYSQKYLNIKKIYLVGANFNLNQDSLDYVNNFLKGGISKKKIYIQKSKIFFSDELNNEDILSIYSIKKSEIFYNQNKNYNIVNIKGSIFNSNTDIDFIFNNNETKKINTIINFKELNLILKNEITKNNDKKLKHKGKLNLELLRSEIKVNYENKDKLVSFISEDSFINNKNINLNGKINKSPFYFDVNVNFEKIDLIKLIDNLYNITSLLKKNILLNENFNGKISININSLNNIKLFNSALINLKLTNGQFMFNNTTLISEKIGEMNFLESYIQEVNGKLILKSKIYFKIINEGKFYKKFQIKKKDRININNIYLEIDKNLENKNFIIKELIINSKIKDSSETKTIDLSSEANLLDINNIANWIELKSIIRSLFAEIS